MFGKGGNGQGIVSMTDREKQKRLAPLRLLESYWQGLAGQDGQVPLRSQIDPRGIESALEFAFLGERIAPSLAKLRVAGTHLNDLMGMETGGMPLSALFTPEARDRLGDALSKVFAEGAVVRMDIAAEEGFGKTPLEGHLLILPLRSDMGDMTRMIGVLVTTGRIGRTPRRFTITSCEVEPALAAPAPALAPVAQDPMPARLTGMSAPDAPFDHAPQQERHPHLRLVVSND